MAQDRTTSAALPTPERLFKMLWGFATPVLIENALHLGVFNALNNHPGKTLQELSREMNVGEREARALLNALAGLQLLFKENDRYSLTPESRAFLVSETPVSFVPYSHMVFNRLLPGWLNLSRVMREGRPEVPANRETTGVAFFSEMVESLFVPNSLPARALAESLDVANTGDTVRVLDIAAGSGVWSIPMAQASPRVQVTAVDWEPMLKTTQAFASRFEVADQYRFVGGDLDEADFGEGYQVAVLGHIVHSEGEVRSRALLEKVYQALAPGGVVVIADLILNEERTGPPFSLFLAMTMVIFTEQGDIFTFGEMTDWLTACGFTDVRLLEVPAPSPLVLATKPKT